MIDAEIERGLEAETRSWEQTDEKSARLQSAPAADKRYAGARPNNTPDAIAMTNVNARTGTSIAISGSRGTLRALWAGAMNPKGRQR